MNYYDVAQICMNGHIITDMAKSNPQFRKSNCTKCGEPTIINCLQCNSPIQGYYHVDGVVQFGHKPILHSFCYHCGKPYPWTEKKIQATKELIDELDELKQEERDKLKNSIYDLIADTPRSEVAVTLIKKNIPKINKMLAKTLLDMVVSIATDTIKKSLLGM